MRPCQRKANPGIMRQATFLLGLLIASCGPVPTSEGAGVPTVPRFTPLAEIPTWTPTATSAIQVTPTPPLALRPYDWSLGPEEARVTLVAYADFQSEACARLAPALLWIQRAHPQDVRLVFRPYPLIPLHDKASLAAQAAHAAGMQGAFWAMYDFLFERQEEWQGLAAEQFHTWLVQAAPDLGLDAHALDNDLSGARYEALMSQAFQEAYSSGIPGTPVLYFNGSLFTANLSASNLEAAVRLELLREHQFAAFPPNVLQPDTDYLARLVFDVGEILVDLHPESAPQAVNSFVFLAQQGWYDYTPVHHVIPGVLIEMGDPTGTGLGGPGYFFRTEIDPSLAFDEPGMVALSSVGPDTNGSQFFITLRPLPELDRSRTIFGRVLTGLDWASRLPARDPMADLLAPPAATLQRILIETR